MLRAAAAEKGQMKILAVTALTSLDQGDLQDLAFYHLYPSQFADLEARVAERLKIGRTASRKISDRLEEELSGAGIETEISSRVKRYYSIFSKLRRQGIDISLFDWTAIRLTQVQEYADGDLADGVALALLASTLGRQAGLFSS